MGPGRRDREGSRPGRRDIEGSRPCWRDGKGRGHFGGDPGRLWPPPKWPGHGETAEGSGERRGSSEVRVEFVREKRGTSPWREEDVTDVGLPCRGRRRLLSCGRYGDLKSANGERALW